MADKGNNLTLQTVAMCGISIMCSSVIAAGLVGGIGYLCKNSKKENLYSANQSGAQPNSCQLPGLDDQGFGQGNSNQYFGQGNSNQGFGQGNSNQYFEQGNSNQGFEQGNPNQGFGQGDSDNPYQCIS